jgi:hypothetical protein
MARLTAAGLAIVLTLAGCAKPDPVDGKAARAAAKLPDVNAPAPTTIGEPHVATSPAHPLPAPAATIPAALQGRWGLSPADCTSTRGDAKGLLVVSPGELRFYESAAVPDRGVETDLNSISGRFAFTGEGQSWTKYEALKLDKQVLVRTEANPTASFSYAKCS